MHSRIFEITKSKKSVKEHRIDDDYGKMPYVMCNVDYVTRAEDRDADIRWLMTVLPEGCFELEGDCLTMTKQPTEFVDSLLAEIQEAVSNLTAKDLIEDCSLKLFDVKTLVTNQYDTFLVDDSDNYGVQTYRQWLCRCCNDEVGTKYYIGGVQDYHF